jgi:hypothetical protein
MLMDSKLGGFSEQQVPRPLGMTKSFFENGKVDVPS